jgi:release factor glutamine methyltransferase
VLFYLDHQLEQSIITKLRIAGCVFAEDETRLLISEAQALDDLHKMVELRVRGLPLEHVIGYADFCGLPISVDVGVFVPRQRTVFLVRQAVAHSRPGDIVVDLCCGSGAAGAALATALGRIELYSVDIDSVAVQCANRNISAFGGHVLEGDLYEALPHLIKGRVDILVSNAPYVPTEAIKWLPQEARIYEAKVALDGGKDGLDIQRRIAEEAPLWLAAGGHLLIETSERQAPQTVEIFASHGLITKVTRDDELDATVVIGTKPGH